MECIQVLKHLKVSKLSIEKDIDMKNIQTLQISILNNEKFDPKQISNEMKFGLTEIQTFST